MDNLNAVEILVVEDDPYDAELTMRVLKKAKIADEIFNVEDGEEALNFIFGRGHFARRDVDKQPKLILLDLKLPKINGFQVIKELRANAKTSLIPIVVFTSSKESPDIETAYELGANSYVVKPVNIDTFFQTMHDTGSYWLLVNEALKHIQ